MAKHFEVKQEDGRRVIHLDGVQQPGDMAICGSDLMGDSHLGWEMAKETSKKVNCNMCIRMHTYFNSIPKTELGKPIP